MLFKTINMTYDVMYIAEPLKGECWSCVCNCAHRNTNYSSSFWRISICIE